MKLAIMGHGNGSKALAKALGIIRNKPGDVVIRWRNMARIPFRYTLEWNNRDAITKSSDKFKALEVLKNAGLLVPPYSRTFEELPLQVGDIAFGRTRFHTKGQDILALKVLGRGRYEYFYPQDGSPGARENFLTKEYFVKWLDSIAEYRTHVAFGKVILRTKKIACEGITREQLLAAKYIRNHQNGLWKQVVCQPTERFDEACIKAIKAFGLDFGAVDFLNVDGKPYILEVNTAPGLEIENRIEVYKDAFLSELENCVR